MKVRVKLFCPKYGPPLVKALSFFRLSPKEVFLQCPKFVLHYFPSPHAKRTLIEVYLTQSGQCSKHTSLTSLKADSDRSIPRLPHSERPLIKVHPTQNGQCSKHTSLTSLKADSDRSIPHLPHSKRTLIEVYLTQNGQCSTP